MIKSVLQVAQRHVEDGFHFISMTDGQLQKISEPTEPMLGNFLVPEQHPQKTKIYNGVPMYSCICVQNKLSSILFVVHFLLSHPTDCSDLQSHPCSLRCTLSSQHPSSPRTKSSQKNSLHATFITRDKAGAISIFSGDLLVHKSS